MWWFLNNPTKNNPLISWALSLNVWMMRLLRVIENFQILVENVAENLQHITQGRETPSGQSPANVVAPLCCCCWFCAVLHWGDNCLCSSGPQITAAAHGRPPLLLADYTQTKTEKRGTKSSAPIALSFIHDWDTSVDNQSLNWEEYYWWYIIYPEILNCVKKLCVLVIPFKSLGNCQSQVITTKLETSPFPLKKLTIEYKILQKWVWNGFWVGPFWHFWLPTVKVRWHFLKKVCLIYKSRGIL